MEDKEHIFKCLHPNVEIQWEKSLTNLENWMVLSKTEPMVRQTILSRLHTWRTAAPGMGTHEPGSYMTHLQDKLGWNQALEVVLAPQWRNQQAQYWQ